MSRVTNRPEPEAPPLSAGWRVAALVWVAAFGGLIGFELLLFAWNALRGMF
jgi:hypothetical protein